jgi:hypothetical protein
LPPGLTNLVLEFNGRTITSGPEQGRSTAEVLLGISYNINEKWLIRAAYQVPLYRPQDIESRVIGGVIYHF